MTNAGPNKHQQRTEATRRKLLKAAKRVFARDGFEAARIEDIAAEAGHTRGAFYGNFKTKEDLFFALLEQEVTSRLEELRSTLERCEAGAKRVRAVREFYVKRAGDRQWVMLMLEFRLYAVRHAKMRTKLAAAHRRIRSSLNYSFVGHLIPSLVKQGPTTPEQEIVKALLEAALNGLVLERAYDPKRISEEQVLAALGRVFDVFTQDAKLALK
ncbi:MAG TPA: TetR/AcrR family transcriptional regulator [Bryobacteraceae bacterium]|nr:TetR/AcrR family transcriptional regulator [Bryobacteraceae bacterium]